MAGQLPFELPADFDPEQHLFRSLPRDAPPDLRRGVTVYEVERVDGPVQVFRVQKPARPIDGTDTQGTRCFECHRRENGDVDCYVVPCPPPVVLHE